MVARPLVTFCIATHNRSGVVLDCLAKILANGLPASQFEIRIVDNASTDGTPDLIAQRFPDIHLTRLPKNAGPVAKNVAMRQARGEFLVLLDDDAFPHPGATAQMIRHFRDNSRLAAAVFDVTLLDGSKEASAYPDVFIGAGTGLRRSALEKIVDSDRSPVREIPGAVLPPIATLPARFFMQAEEYDLSFRLLDAGYSIQRFWDLPLTHFKTPSARIGERTTRLDIRNNLFLLARYIPEPLCHQLAADWLSRYWMMAAARDAAASSIPRTGETHKAAFMRGSAEGLARWSAERAEARHLLSPETVEQLFKFTSIRQRLQRITHRRTVARVVFADLGKNMLGYWQAARDLGLEVVAIADDRLGGQGRDYRGVPVLRWTDDVLRLAADGTDTIVVVTAMSQVHAPARAAALRRTLQVPVYDLFSRCDAALHGSKSPPLDRTRAYS